MTKPGWARSRSFGAATALFLLAASSLTADEPGQPFQKGKGARPPSGVYRDRVEPHWFAQDTRFWYRNDLKGGTKEFVLVDAVKGTRALAFDHAKLAAALSKEVEKQYQADRLPFSAIEFSDDARVVRFDAAGEALEMSTGDLCLHRDRAGQEKEGRATQGPSDARRGAAGIALGR